MKDFTHPHAIFYSKISIDELDRSSPIAAITYKDNVVTITGDEDFVDRWTKYFHSPGWQNHVDEGKDDALVSLFGRSTYPVCDVLDEEDAAPDLAKIKKMKDLQTGTVKT